MIILHETNKIAHIKLDDGRFTGEGSYRVYMSIEHKEVINVDGDWFNLKHFTQSPYHTVRLEWKF